MAKVLCILRHRGVQLILAYSWARLVILVTGKGEGNVFISSVSSLSFLFLFLHSPSLSSPLLSLLSLFSLSLGDDTKWPTRVDVSLNPNTINEYICCEYSLQASSCCTSNEYPQYMFCGEIIKFSRIPSLIWSYDQFLAHLSYAQDEL